MTGPFSAQPRPLIEQKRREPVYAGAVARLERVAEICCGRNFRHLCGP